MSEPASSEREIIPIGKPVLKSGQAYLDGCTGWNSRKCFQFGEEELIVIILSRKKRRILAASVGAAAHGRIELFACHDKIHFIDRKTVPRAQLAEFGGRFFGCPCGKKCISDVFVLCGEALEPLQGFFKIQNTSAAPFTSYDKPLQQLLTIT